MSVLWGEVMKVFLLFFLLLLPSPAGETYNPNDFVHSFNLWADQVKSLHTEHTLNAAEIIQWQVVKLNWEQLKRQVDQYYGAKP